jgi:hypothetical protein
MEPVARRAFPPAQAGALLIVVTIVVIATATLVGLAAGSAKTGLVVGAVLAFAGIATSTRYRGLLDAERDVRNEAVPEPHPCSGAAVIVLALPVFLLADWRPPGPARGRPVGVFWRLAALTPPLGMDNLGARRRSHVECSVRLR